MNRKTEPGRVCVLLVGVHPPSVGQTGDNAVVPF